MIVTRCDDREAPHDLERGEPYLWIQHLDEHKRPVLTRYFCQEHVPVQIVMAITKGGVRESVMRWETAI